jgi:hypothetical protein
LKRRFLLFASSASRADASRVATNELVDGADSCPSVLFITGHPQPNEKPSLVPFLMSVSSEM